MIPEQKISEMRGFLKGIDIHIDRGRQTVNLVDSFGWLDYLINGSHASDLGKALCDTDRLIVPTIWTLDSHFKKFSDVKYFSGSV